MECVRTLEELEAVNDLYVMAICPKCGEGWTSLKPNAENIIKHGCLICSDGEWEPVVGVMR